MFKLPVMELGDCYTRKKGLFFIKTDLLQASNTALAQ